MKAKKLPSGSWRCQVYSHTEEILQEDGTIKKKRIYKSFTCDDSSAKGRRKCEQMAADWAAHKERISKPDMTVKDAVQGYIEAKRGVLSPSTILNYESIEKNYIPLIGSIHLDSLTQKKIQEWVSKISAGRSAKTVKNAYGLLVSSVRNYISVQSFRKKKNQTCTFPLIMTYKNYWIMFREKSLRLPFIWLSSVLCEEEKSALWNLRILMEMS